MINKTDLQIKDMVDSYMRKLIYQFPKERDAFKACDIVIHLLATGQKQKALDFATKLVEENKKDPVNGRFSDEKSKKIHLTYALCLEQTKG
jgi:hypothetical protein